MQSNIAEVQELDNKDDAKEYIAKTSISYVITHQLTKDQFQTGDIALTTREKPLAKTLLAQKLVDQLHEIYTNKPSKSFGRFNGNVADSPSQKHVKDYFSDSKCDFKTFSVNMAEALAYEAKRTSAATGGHIFLAQFSYKENDYLLVAVINDEYAIALNDEQKANDDLKEVEFLNLKGLRFAGQLNVTAWQDDEDRYLSFLKGTGNVADYFKRFLACDTSISNLKDTQSLTEVIIEFVESVEVDGEKLSQHAKDEFYRKVDNYCRDAADNGYELYLEEFSNVVWPKAPADLKHALATCDNPISDGFVPHKTGLLGLVKFKGKSKNWMLSFNREAITEHDIELMDDNSIKLRDVPEHLIESLRKEISASE